MNMSKQNPEGLAKKAAQDKELLSQLIEGILTKKASTRFTSFNALTILSEEHPEVLYPEFDHFVDLLGSKDNSSRYIALHIIANLTTVDTEKKFEQVFDKYFNLFDDRNLPTAAHAVGNSGKIAKAKPELETKISKKLLNIDETSHTPEHKDLMKSYAVDAFGEYFDVASDKLKILEFVKKQLYSKSPRARKAVKEFLEKWGKTE